MKLNISLAVILLFLIGVTFLTFIDDKPADPRLNYLLSPIDETQWVLEIDNGKLSRDGNDFFWNEEKIVNTDKDLPKVLVKIGDLRIIRETDDIEWSQEMEQTSFSYNSKEYAISELNELTGRFMIFDKQLRNIYLIEDQAPLQELHKSFEVGQKIKYYNLLNLIKNQRWEI